MTHVSFPDKTGPTGPFIVNVGQAPRTVSGQNRPITNYNAANVSMWLPASIYERVPQFWFLIGLLFISAGLYIGFEYVLTAYYVGLGLLCCACGIGVFLLRLRHRKDRKSDKDTAGASS